MCDQADVVYASGAQVLRLAAKSRESIDSSVSFLTLHNQVRVGT